ncbi:MAG: hypothetical protein ACRBN8_39510 [Nannocystales bacterium]
MRPWILWSVLLGLAPGCDTQSSEAESAPDEYLSRDVVESIPDGDAAGDTFSGSYQTRATVISCVGDCGPIETGGTSYAVCERDAESVEWITAYQEDGTLRVDLDDDGHIGINLDGYIPVRLEGGIDSDGSWDVGGHGTKFGGELESTARARGTVGVGEPLEGTVEVHVFGVVAQTETDCYMTQRLVSVEEPE